MILRLLRERMVLLRLSHLMLRLSRLKQHALPHFLGDAMQQWISFWRGREAVYERVDVPNDLVELALEIIDLRLQLGLTKGL